ncbi:hypothetical protein GOP47_0019361 [Adiantum capillus-veneris]|uniref:Uncharacterized protein n=1 Tax=Adiantum capillus-veneris TaxID=13818 RepID=A0A9D4UCP6_ADICA|nr:hypothetical protein GOP47_0019361 [Adiantum capillus-veneris]
MENIVLPVLGLDVAACLATIFIDTNVFPYVVLVPSRMNTVPIVKRLSITSTALFVNSVFLPTRSNSNVAMNMKLNLRNPTPTIAPNSPSMLCTPAS